jgi:hypothetical protein
MHSGGGFIIVFAWVNNLFIQQDFPLDVDPHKSMVNGSCKQHKLVVVVVVVSVVVVSVVVVVVVMS